MPWVKLDDQFFVNRKARAVGVDGRALFVASMAYCGMQLNDGKFPESDVPVIAALAGVAPDIAEALLKHGLWESPEPGLIEVHDYLKYNPSRSDVLVRKERAEKAGAASAASRRTTSPTASQPIPSPSPLVVSSSSTSTETAPPEVWTMMAQKKLRTATGVKNAVAWCRTTADNDRAELGDRADWLWSTYEFTTLGQLVDVLLAGGSSSLLNSLPKRGAA